MKATSLLSLCLLVILQLGRCHSIPSSSDANIDSQPHNNQQSSQTLSRQKRGSYNMMRLGRGLRMLRLGKRSGSEIPESPSDMDDDILGLLQEYYGQFQDSPNDEFGTYDSSHPRFRRSTSSEEDVIEPQLLSLDGEEMKVDGTEQDDMDQGFVDKYGFYPGDFYGDWEVPYEPEEDGEDFEKRAISMLRLGRNAADDENADLDSDILKRPMSMLRLGKRPMSMLRLGKRPMSMLRLGKRPMTMLRLGKRPMSMLRLGKRPMGMLRLGKRPMSMLRLGKRPMGMLRLGKRPMGMLRLGKRPMSMLRLGKRPMSMLRLGKRPMSMLRLGKRPMSMLRLGKRDDEETEDKRAFSMQRLAKRPMSMLRLGKRPMSMLRLGKRDANMMRLGDAEQERSTA